MNKKAYIYDVTLAFATFVTLLMAFMIYASASAEEKLGADQSKIINTFQESQKELFYLDTAAVYSGINSIYELALRGGFAKTGPCGKYYSISMWSNKNPEEEYSECIPKIENEITFVMDEKMGEMLKKRSILNSDYKYFAKLNHSLSITGMAVADSSMNIGSTAERTYIFRPAFTKNYNYDAEAYILIKEFIDELNEKCKELENTKEKTELTDCVYSFMNEFDAGKFKLDALFPPITSELIFYDVINQVERMNYANCYFTGKMTEQDASFEIEKLGNSQIYTVNDEKKLMKTTPVTFHVAGKNNFDEMVPYPSEKISYSTEEKKITYDFEGEKTIEMENPAFFIFMKDIAAFVPDREVNDYMVKRPCEYEERTFTFFLLQNEIYPDEGDISYYFAVYVKDEKKPQFSMSAEDKQFDENSLMIKWQNTDSLDLKKYEVYINGKLAKTVVPWQNVNVYDTIQWDYGKPFSNCELVTEGIFKKCKNLVDGNYLEIERGETYFFRQNNEFVYVASGLQPGSYSVKIKAVDDDLNYYEQEASAEVKDDLPLNPLQNFLIIPALLPPEFESYESVTITPIDFIPINMDGTSPEGFSGAYYIFEDVNSNEVPVSLGKSGFVLTFTLNRVHLIAENSNFLLAPSDPSLEEGGIKTLFINEMGYKTQAPIVK